jgi:acyl-[acyl-carrier-protein] desaturase
MTGYAGSLTGAETQREDDVAVLRELAPAARALVERHLSNAKEWFPHELVPWGRGRDYEPDEVWAPEEAPGVATDRRLDDAVRSSLFVNLLTEDNLPHYFRTIDKLFSEDDPWGYWTRRWTAEEGRHSIVMRDYLMVSRSIDPVALERGRMAQVTAGEVPQPATVVYVSLQELATRISHGNTGRLLRDDVGRKVMARVAGDEFLHHVFYRDLTSALLELDPSTTMVAIDRNVRGFAMPGTGIPGFAGHARAIAAAGIYDFAAHHDHILQPVVLGTWNIEALEGLSPEAELAREQCIAYIARVGKAGRRSTERRESDTAVAS